MERREKVKILVAGDTHFPYNNKKATRWFLEAVKREKPTHVVQIGDLYDQYCFSNFTKKNIETSVSEIKRARKSAEEFWAAVRQRAPRAKCYQILGNHDARLAKRVLERVPEAFELVKEKINELYTFRKVRTLHDDRDILKIGRVSFTHGHFSKSGDHMRYQWRNIVVGHSHVGGTVFEQRLGRTLWELNAGYLGDCTAEPMRYLPTRTNKWTLGYGLITGRGNQFEPQFVPYE